MFYENKFVSSKWFNLSDTFDKLETSTLYFVTYLQALSDSLTHGVSEHQDYEAALAEAERALLAVSQQLTSQGALPDDTSSLAENQQQLAKHQVSNTAFTLGQKS